MSVSFTTGMVQDEFYHPSKELNNPELLLYRLRVDFVPLLPLELC